MRLPKVKTWEELTIGDHFLFQKVMRNRRICKQSAIAIKNALQNHLQSVFLSLVPSIAYLLTSGLYEKWWKGHTIHIVPQSPALYKTVCSSFI